MNLPPVDNLLLSEAARLVALALDEDLGPGDITTQVCLAAGRPGRGAIVARQSGVVAGLWLAKMVYERIDPSVVVTLKSADGDAVEAGRELAVVTGPAASLLTGERTALNFLQRLSGIATLTRRFVEAVRGTKAVICDTRKTTPGWRHLEKYAVRCGGGTNHRLGLYDMVLIKDNHIALSGRPIDKLVAEARARVGPQFKIEVEVDTLDQLRAVLPLPVDFILLDNMTAAQMCQAVALRDQLRPGGAPLLETSGGVTLQTVREFAETGVDRISVGALTHSAPALDIALDIREPNP
jgi:nicotinate-nucleotide pyrophosphorylase (carboxylating)